MRIETTREVEVAGSYRVDRALNLFNVGAEAGRRFSLRADLPVDEDGLPEGDWRIGVVVGPSGSGKSTIGTELYARGWTEWGTEGWPANRAVIDAIGPDADFDSVTAALASVGLGTVPSWLRPFRVLSNGERFRAELARLLVERVDRVVIDEFTSVVDRRVAQIGSQAFAKAWRRGEPRRVVLLTPHFDILPWVKPDWVVQTTLVGEATNDTEPLVSRDPGSPTILTVTA